MRGTDICPEAIQARLNKPPKNLKSLATTATCLALVQAALRGLPNKVNRDLKEAYLMAANLAGGKEGLVGYLKKQAELENPSAFMTGLSKLAPALDAGGKSGRAAYRLERVYYTRDGDA